MGYLFWAPDKSVIYILPLQLPCCMLQQLNCTGNPITSIANLFMRTKDGCLWAMACLLWVKSLTYVSPLPGHLLGLSAIYFNAKWNVVWCKSVPIWMPLFHHSRTPFHSVQPHDNDCMLWKQCLYYWPFVRGIHRSQMDSHHKRSVNKHLNN